MKIPYVKAVDKDTGIEVKGFYFEYPSTTYCFLEDYSSFSVPLIPCIVSYTSGDWRLPNNPKLCHLIGICQGKHNFDKREALKEKQVKRDINRALKERSKL